MKFMILMSAVVGLVFGKPDINYYVTADDYVDIDYVVANMASLQEYVDCYLDKGPCTTITQSFKDVIPDCIIKACDRCNVPQKQAFGRFLLNLKNKLPEDYQNFQHKFDPNNIYFDKLEAELSKFWNYKERAHRPQF